MMKSPKERYANDNVYRTAVDQMEAMIHQAYFTPSEMREMAVLASIHYELRHGFRQYTVPMQVNDAFKTLTDWRKKEDEAVSNNTS